MTRQSHGRDGVCVSQHDMHNGRSASGDSGDLRNPKTGLSADEVTTIFTVLHPQAVCAGVRSVDQCPLVVGTTKKKW